MSAEPDSKKQNGMVDERVLLPKSGIADWLILGVLGLFALCLLGGLLFLWRPALPAPIASLAGPTPTPLGAAPTRAPAYPSAIWRTRYSPDGTRIVTGEFNGIVRVWDAITGEQLALLRGHTRPLWGVAYSPDGKQIVSWSDDQTARIWDAATGKELAVLRGEYDWDHVWSAEYSPDAKQILVATDSQTSVWDTTTMSKLREFKGGDLAAYSPDGSRIVTVDHDDGYIYDAATGGQLSVLSGHTEAIWDLAYSPDGKKIVTVSKDMTGRIWDAGTGSELAVLRGHSDQVWSAAFSPDSQQVVTGSDDHTVRIWDATTGKEALVLEGHTKELRGVAYSSDGRRILSWSDGEAGARLWDAVTGQELSVLKAGDSLVKDAAYSADGQRIATAHTDGTAHVWDAGTGGELQVLRAPEAAAAAKATPTATPTFNALSTPAATLLPLQATATAQAVQSELTTSAGWPLVLSDSFDAPGHGWTTDKYDTGTLQATKSIANGKYQWQVKSRSSNLLDLDIPMDLPGHRPGTVPMSEYAVSVDGRQVGGTPNCRYGLVFGYDWESHNYYVFTISDDQSFEFAKGTGEVPGRPSLMGKSAAIKPGAVNRITVVAGVRRLALLPTGNYFTFFVNDQFVAQVEDSTVRYGDTGPAVEFANVGDSAVFEFDNFEVRAP